MNYYTINELATFLHLTPKQIQRMAEREQIPGQRLDGEWRFSHAEINQWLENKLHNQQYEEVVASHLISLHDLMSVEGIALPLEARTASSVIDAMVETGVATGLLWDAAAMAEAVRTRENMLSTTLECGVALMHPRRPMTKILAEPFVALGITSRPIPTGDAGSGMNGMADVFFLICSTDDTTHLRTLARISKLLRLDNFLDNLRNAESPQEILSIVEQAEERLSNG